MTTVKKSFLASAGTWDRRETLLAFSTAVFSGRDLFAITGITKFRYIEVPFHIFYCCQGIKNGSLCQGPRYKEVCYIQVPLYFNSWSQ